MAIFYAYAKDLSNEKGNRYLMAFASREAADEWWRVVHTKKLGFNRISPQFYTFDGNAYNHVSGTVEDENCAPTFKNSVIFSLLSPRDEGMLSIIPQQNVRDHINNDTFFIRSRADPHSFWYVDAKGGIRASIVKRTLFRISIRNDDDKQKIMIGSDQVFISPAREPTKVVWTGDGGFLRLTGKDETHTRNFGALRCSFLASDCWQRVSDKEDSRILHVDQQLGEAWELV